ncbi:smc family protein [Qipengyuania citrea LAMA 915]|uniref:Smc family protein n=1 Tax=Qipengyuania citrea LAMA 915 TaxID=1306953 RepID=A0A0L1KFH8_9SPHN|nr:smc family protein [Qipengyuania citrea LAMA 915]
MRSCPAAGTGMCAFHVDLPAAQRPGIARMRCRPRALSAAAGQNPASIPDAKRNLRVSYRLTAQNKKRTNVPATEQPRCSAGFPHGWARPVNRFVDRHLGRFRDVRTGPDHVVCRHDRGDRSRSGRQRAALVVGLFKPAPGTPWPGGRRPSRAASAPRRSASRVAPPCCTADSEPRDQPRRLKRA